MAPVPAVITAQQALRSATNSHPALLKFAQQHGIKSVLKGELPSLTSCSGVHLCCVPYVQDFLLSMCIDGWLKILESA